MRIRLRPKQREEEILLAAIRVARRPGGWGKLTRSAIAREANCADGLVSKYLGSMEAIRRRLMKEAIKHELFDLIAQGLSAGDPAALRITAHLKTKAFAYVCDQE